MLTPWLDGVRGYKNDGTRMAARPSRIGRRISRNQRKRGGRHNPVGSCEGINVLRCATKSCSAGGKEGIEAEEETERPGTEQILQAWPDLHGSAGFDLPVPDSSMSQQSCSDDIDMPVLSCIGQWLIVISMTIADDATRGIANASMKKRRRRSSFIRTIISQGQE